MAAPRVVVSPPTAHPRRPRVVGPVAWLVGGALALATAAAAAVVAVLFAAVMVVVALLAALLLGLAYAAARTRRAARAPAVMTARWTGYGWDAG